MSFIVILRMKFCLRKEVCKDPNFCVFVCLLYRAWIIFKSPSCAFSYVLEPLNYALRCALISFSRVIRHGVEQRVYWAFLRLCLGKF